MRTVHTPCSRAASVAMILLVVAQSTRLIVGQSDSYVMALLCSMAVATALVTTKLFRDNCLESRIGSAALVALSGGGVVLASIAGLPGQPEQPLGVLGFLTCTLSAAVLVLLTLDQRRRAAGQTLESQYAS